MSLIQKRKAQTKRRTLRTMVTHSVFKNGVAMFVVREPGKPPAVFFDLDRNVTDSKA